MIDFGRIWNRINTRPDLPSGSDERMNACWEWTGAATYSGHGRAGYQGVNQQVHRLVYEQIVGPIPDGLFIMHLCDNPPCCNVRHLRPGTQAENVKDCVAKGRNAVGARSNKRGLTDEQAVFAMARLLTGKETHRAVGKAFGVGRTTIGQLWTRSQWVHLWQDISE